VRTRAIGIVVLLLTLGFSGVCFAERPSVGIIPFYSPEKIWKLYTPLVEYLRETTGISWELKLYHNHESIIHDICNGNLSIALFGPIPFVRAYEKCGVKPLLVALGENGEPYYRSVIVTNDPGIRSLKDLKGKKFAFFEGSTAAHLLPRKMLDDEGVAVDSIQPIFLGSQDRIIDALLKHEVAAAGVKESLYRRFEKSPLKVLAVSDAVPNFVFCSTPALSSQVEKKFVQALTALKPLSDPSHKQTVRAWDDEVQHGFITPPKTYLQDVLELKDIIRKYRQ